MRGVHCNCELGDALEMAPNLISHHLREAGLIEMERLEALNAVLLAFLDPARIQPRRPDCGPKAGSS